MSDAQRKPLRSVAKALVVISILTQVAVVAYACWDFDPRLSCDRLLHWDEWIDCLHGKSHEYVLAAENAVGSWVIAGVALLLARLLPAYVSMVAPGLVLIWIASSIADQIFLDIDLRGSPTAKEILVFMMSTAKLVIFMVGPVLGAWLLGVDDRARRRRLLLERIPLAFG